MPALPRGDMSDFLRLAELTVAIAAHPNGMIERRLGISPLSLDNGVLSGLALDGILL